MTKRSRGEKVFAVFNAVLMIVLSATCLLPLLNVVAISLSSSEMAASGTVTIIPKNFTLISYKSILSKPIFLQTFRNSFLRVGLSVPLSMFLTVTAAYPLSKGKEKLMFRQFYVWFYVLTMLFSGGLIPLYLTVRNLKLLNNFWSIILPGAVSVYNIVLMLNFFKTIPDEIEEAATIDGASYWCILWKIFVPCSGSTIATLTLFSTVSSWNEWFYPQIFLNRMEDYPLQSYLQVLINQVKDSTLATLSPKELEELSKVDTRTYNAAQIVISSIPILAIYPFLQRYFVTGITLGSVKG